MSELAPYIAGSIAVCVSIWKDAQPGTRFPSVDELVRIEIGRVLGSREVLRNIPGSLRHSLNAEPWDMDPRALVAQVESFAVRSGKNIAVLGREYLDNGHLNDAAMSIITRRPAKLRIQLHDREDFDSLVHEVARVLGTGTQQCEQAWDVYRSVYRQLS